MDQNEVFHAGEQLMQSRVGVRERMAMQGRQVIRDSMPDQHRSFFAALPWLAVAVCDTAGWPVGTILSGPPGFVTSPDQRTLRIASLPRADDPAAAGFVAGAPIGLLGIDLSTRRRNRANGRIATLDAGAATIAVAQSFGNCPQYIQRRQPLEARRLAGTPQRFTTMDPADRDLVAASDTFFVASGTSEAGLDMSHRGGRPGFVRVTGDTLTIPDFAGNRYFNTLGNFVVAPKGGLLFIDFATGDLLQLNGEVEIDWTGEEVAAFAGAQRLWHVHVTQGWRIPGALPLQWSPPEYAPQTERTGRWQVA
jgi:predicted pyridoxine 5'-phosphate oxidase superfamily flavin-nucleotide-binding protein